MSLHPELTALSSSLRWVAVDSDGCVFDSMRPKHAHCFAPALAQTWDLGDTGPEVLDAFVQLNLLSQTRGVNRYLALSIFWPWLVARGMGHLPSMDRFLAWARGGEVLSESGLAAAIAAFPEDEGLRRAAAWSKRVDQLVALLPAPAVFVEAIPTLAAIARSPARLYVVSSGARGTIEAEWHEAGLARHVTAFFTQETGSKARALTTLRDRHGGERGLMVGDALADANAAQETGTAFFPIEPDHEDPSWCILRKRVLPAYLDGGHVAVDSAGGVKRLAERLGRNAKASLQFS